MGGGCKVSACGMPKAVDCVLFQITYCHTFMVEMRLFMLQ